MRDIPIRAAEVIARDFGYDQIIIIGRKIGTAPDPNGEHVTTFGIDPKHCAAAARIGRAIMRIMGWPEVVIDPYDDALLLRAREAVAIVCSRGGAGVTIGQLVRAGKADNSSEVQAALLALSIRDGAAS